MDSENSYIRHDKTLEEVDADDLAVYTELEFNVQLKSETSRLIEINDYEKTTNSFALTVRDSKVEFSFTLGNQQTYITSTMEVYSLTSRKQKWFNIRASRYGRHGILEVTPLSTNKQNGILEASDVVEIEADVDTVQWHIAKPNVIIGGEQSHCSVIDVLLNHVPINQWLYNSKSDHFTNNNEKINLDKFRETFRRPLKEEQCDTSGSCWSFTGQSSWAHLTDKDPGLDKYLINTRTGTIMFQMKLKSPLQSNGLIFFIGDPTQSKYFIGNLFYT